MTAVIRPNTIAIGCAPRIVFVRAAESDTGLSTGSKAAIGTCVALAVVIATVIIYLVLRRHRQRRSNKKPSSIKNENVLELEGSSKLARELEGDAEPFKAEADAKDTEMEIYELADTGVVEVPEDTFSPIELGGRLGEDTKDSTSESMATIGPLSTSEVAISPVSPAEQTTTKTQPPHIGTIVERFSFEQKP